MTGPTSFGRRVAVSSLLATLLLGPGGESSACGPDTDCSVGSRTYRIAVPEDHGAGVPAIVFLHGYRGKASGVMRNEKLAALASELGAALIAAQAAGPEWNIPDIPSADALEDVDELAYFDGLLKDAVRRFGIDATRVYVTGFSSGAMAVWHLACYRGGTFAGFIPMSGTFWEPVPETCPTIPRNLIHYHGTADPIVPLAGRQIKDARQGDVRQAFELVRRLSDYRPQPVETAEDLTCSSEVDGEGRRLELCLFPGEHEFRVYHLRRAAGLLGLEGLAD